MIKYLKDCGSSEREKEKESSILEIKFLIGIGIMTNPLKEINEIS